MLCENGMFIIWIPQLTSVCCGLRLTPILLKTDCSTFYHKFVEIFWSQPIGSFKLCHVTGAWPMSPSWGGWLSRPQCVKELGSSPLWWASQVVNEAATNETEVSTSYNNTWTIDALTPFLTRSSTTIPTMSFTGDPLHSRALAHSRAPLFTQPCPHCEHSRAPGEKWARLCVFTLQGCVQAARLCRGSLVHWPSRINASLAI